MAVTRIETALVSLPFVAVIAVAGWAVNSTYQKNERKNAPARAAGFFDAAEMKRATDAGFASPRPGFAFRSHSIFLASCTSMIGMLSRIG
jgi:hypothetical protein